jgi:hypothetical protein
MARISLVGITQDKLGDDESFTYAVEKHPKTKLVVQKSRDRYWFVYKITGKNVITIGDAHKTEKEATAECIRYASWMEPDTSRKR